LLTLSPKLWGQNDTKDTCNCDNENYIGVGGPEKLASFPGGQKAYMAFLLDNLVYPEETKPKRKQRENK